MTERRYSVIRNGRVLDIAGHRAPKADILIDGDSIAEIGAPALAAPSDATLIDASDRLIHPGLINAHTHGHGNLSKGMGDRWTLELLLTAAPWISGNRTAEDKYLSTYIGALEMLMKGCTACYDLTVEFPQPTQEGLAACARAYADAGMRAVVAPMVASVTIFEAIPGLLEVLPPPLQRPHPPLWIAASNLATYEHAARQGVGVIGVTRNSIEETRSAIRTYREIIRSGDRSGWIGKFANENVGAFALTCCHEDDRIGRDLACAASRWYNGDNDVGLNRVRFATAGGKDAVVAKFRARTNDQLIEDGMAIGGNPDSICRQVEQWANAGLDQMIFVVQAGRLTHADAVRSIELIGRHVIPRFASRSTAAAE